LPNNELPEWRARFRRTPSVLKSLYTAFSHIAALELGDDPVPSLRAILREVADLIGADLLTLRLPVGTSDHLDVRVPEESSWPSARTLQRWHTTAYQRKHGVVLSARSRPRGMPYRHGALLPVFTPAGAVGLLGAFRSRAARFSAEECSCLIALVQAIVARLEAARLRQDIEAMTTTDVHEQVAREIHDGPLQLLSGIMLHLRLVRAAGDPKLEDAFLRLEGEMEQAIKQTRALIRTLRVSHPDAALEERLRDALARLGQAHGLTWSLRWNDPEGALQDTVADEIFQVINEALANVYRHSSAKHVEVSSRVVGETFEITVRDDGVGFNVAQALRLDTRRLSFGLISMQERVSALGGVLTLRSQPGQGTRVLISLPLGRLEVSKGA
jgi:signal transduction histidine kinase